MTDYTKTTNFAAKDSLPSGNANKIVKGAEIDTEFNNIATASATKANIAGPTFTGTVTIPTADINGGAVDGTTIGAASASSIVGTTIVANTSINIAGDGATVTGIKDEDDMSSNSATKLATQQSIKAYVDSQVTAQDLDVTDGSSSIDIDLDSESLGILGGTGIDSTASGTGVTLAIDSTVTTLTGSQTLTNKTLTAPTLTGTTVAASLDISGDVDVDGTLETDALSINGTTVTSTAAELNILDGVTATAAELNIMDGVTATTAELNIMDGVTSTAAELNILDGKAFLDEDDMSSNSATGIASQQSIKAYVDSQVTAQDLDFQADSGGALSIDLDSETLTFTGGTGIDTSGSGNAVTFAIDSTVATLTGSQTLTNKTLTAPTLTGTAVVASLDISGDIDVDGTTNLDVVDIDGAVDMASTLTVGGEVFIAEKLTHTGDTDTHFKFAGANDIRIVAGDVEHAAFDGTIVFNQSGSSSMDFRVESDSQEHMLFVDASANRIGIANNAPASALDVTGSVTADGLTVDGTSTFSPNSGTLDVKVGTHDATNNVRLNAGGTTSTYLEYRGYLGHIFDVNTTRMMTLTSTGLGIGTSNPSAPLNISATYSSNTTEQFRIQDNTGGKLDFFGHANGNRAIQAYEDNGSTFYDLLLQPLGGNVGIGTSSPSFDFEVNRATASATALISSGNNDAALRLYTSNNVGKWRLLASNTTQDLSIANLNSGATAFDTRLTIDSSGNLLVGDSSATFNDTAKTVIRPSADNWVIKPAVCTSFNRSGSDGDILEFYRGASSKVGSIGSVAGARPYFSSPNTGISPYNQVIYPVDGSGAVTNGVTDIGHSSYRFKDLYLSGGAYLGGTAAANKLDDYEEGTYQTTLTCSTGAITLNGSYDELAYTKVGNLVTVTGYLSVSSVSSPSGVLFIGLPFTSLSGSKYGAGVFLSFNVLASGSVVDAWGIIDNNSNTIQVYVGSGSSVSATFANRVVATTDIRVQATYMAA